KRRVPRDAFVLHCPLGASEPERMQDTLRVVFGMRVVRNFAPAHARHVFVSRLAVRTSDRALVDQSDIVRTMRRAILLASRMADPLCTWEPGGLIHALPL